MSNRRTLLDLEAEIKEGDGGKSYAEVRIGDVTVTVYESLVEPGRVVVDIDTETDRHLEVPSSLAVAINDHYVHGGPADGDTIDRTKEEG